ncbi:MAG: hypothetical protein RIB84_17785 [Sneathiellaceae bacterium]
MSEDDDRVEGFIERWQGREGGQERANYALFLSELCDLLQVSRPDPADATSEGNDYVFERVVKEIARDGAVSSRRIDLYKRDCFVLEAKQSRQKGGTKEIEGPPQSALMPADDSADVRGRRATANRAWDVLMMNARRQAENYVRLLPDGHEPPPFVIVCDVGHCLEVYANFRRDGKAYDQFPDRRGFRVYLEELRQPDIRARLTALWTDPLSLDPARHSARVTRAIAERLASVSKSLEEGHHPPEEVAMFLMRTIFTMFAEDVGLLPERSFMSVLERCVAEPDKFVPLVGQLWEAMDRGGFAYAIEANVRRFNGEFFRRKTVLPLASGQIAELLEAAAHDWCDVEPAIFGTLLEQALDPAERRRLGAHYTPRAYVERLVAATVMEPLHRDWAAVLSTAERQHMEGRTEQAGATVRRFHDSLCRTRVLDPACGTGNFLYVALELLKRLEGEVLEALADLGGQEAIKGLEGHTVDPHQFLGMEVNPRAAAIAELVLWIGHLQWHFRTKGGPPGEPILRAFQNIQAGDAVLTPDSQLVRDERGRPVTQAGPDGRPVERYSYRNPTRPAWPEAEFIVGNPPFIGGKDLRARFGDDYVAALWAAHPQMNDSADFVMYWWDRAAELLAATGSVLRRFGFVTTNSISQVFQRRVTERHLKSARPVSIVMAIPDHPWTRASPDAAAVRIAMTVVENGAREGVLHEVLHESGLQTDTPHVVLSDRTGMIFSDLTVGVDVTAAVPLLANEGLCSPGVKLHGSGFIVTEDEAARLGLHRQPGLERHIRPYRNGRDLTARPRGVMVIDMLGLDAEDVRRRFPEAYQHLLTRVKPERDKNNRPSYRDNWWIFGEPRRELRPALSELHRYIATVETAKYRIFQFLEGSILPDNKLLVWGTEKAVHLGVLSSRFHVTWAMRAGGWLGVGNDSVYAKTRCFDPFPFPLASDKQAGAIRQAAEDLDAHRKARQADHPDLTLTGMYNVLERLREGIAPDRLAPKERQIYDQGLVAILGELHDRLDVAVAAAYGWDVDLPEEEILARLVQLNRERVAEEARGSVRWLRPDYQQPRFGRSAEGSGQMAAELVAALPKAVRKPSFPADDMAQTAAVMAALVDAPAAVDVAAIARQYRRGKTVEVRIAATLAALARMGYAATTDGGSHYILRRAA